MDDPPTPPIEDDLTSPLLDRDVHVACDEAPSRPPGCATVLQTTLIILSVYVGLGLLSQPYALRLGGWSALALLAACTAIFAASALMLPMAFALLPSGTPHSYTALGGAALGGRPGRALVAALAGLELFGGLTIALAVVYRQLELLLPSRGLLGVEPLTLAVICSAAALAPMLAVNDVGRLAPLSAVGSAASCLVVVAVLSLLVMDPHRARLPQQPVAGHSLARFPGALQSVGIFALSSSGHSVLPALRGSMRSPAHFPAAVVAAFSAMGLVYGAVAAAGYYYWGEAVSAVLTTDLATNSPFTHPEEAHGSGAQQGWRLPVGRLLAALVVVNCASKRPRW